MGNLHHSESESASEYLRKLFERNPAAQRRLEVMLIEALDSGESIEMDDAWWAERHAELERRRAMRATLDLSRDSR